MTDHRSFTSAYMDVMHDEDELLLRAKEYLEGVEFDTFVGTGISGTVAALRLSRLMDKRYLLVRKPNDGTHSSKSAEGTLGKRWVFVDDLVASGRTLVRVWNKMKSYNNWEFQSEFAGVFLYGNGFDRAQFILPAELAEMPGGAEGWSEMIDRILDKEAPAPKMFDPFDPLTAGTRNRNRDEYSIRMGPPQPKYGIATGCPFGAPGCTCSV